MIKTRYATVHMTDTGCYSEFYDGSGYGAHPHDLPHYHALAHRLGYDGDILKFCREHEVAHHLVAEEFDAPSRVLWPLAHGHEPVAWVAAAEEALVMCLQGYARTNQHPFVDRIDWQALKIKFLNAVEGI